MFEARVAQAKLLLIRLNADVGSIVASKVLEEPVQGTLNICCALYLAYAAITAQVCALEHRGFELIDHWKQRSECALNHLEAYLFSEIRGDQVDDFTAYVAKTAIELSSHREILFPVIAR